MNPVHSFSYGDVIREHRRSRAGRLAVVDGGVRLTWQQLDDRVNQLCAGLRGPNGPVGTDSLILWMGQNSHRLLETIVAAAKMGARVLPANWRSGPAEMADVIARTRPDLVLWQEAGLGDWAAEVRDLTASVPARWIGHDDPGPHGYEQLLVTHAAAADDREVPVDPGRPLLVLMTSAFEGRPLGAQLTQQALLLQGLQIGHLQALTDDARTVVVGPMFHIATLLSVNATYCWGGACVFAPAPAAAEVAAAIEAESCTHGFIPGPVLQEIRDGGWADRHVLTSMFATADAIDPGAPIVAGVSSLWQQRPGLAYGQTETTGTVVLRPLSGGPDPSRGKPPPLASVRILRPDGGETDIDEVGEIVVRGPLVMAGYLGDPEATASRWNDGWHHTNDLGRRHPDGSISFVGPKTALIKTGSENVYPAEVERCLLGHPAVAEVCVIGVPDPTWTQNVKAVVVARAGADPSELTAAALADFCRGRIASYKKPKEVEVVAALPTAAGFPDRAEINRLYGGGGYPGSG